MKITELKCTACNGSLTVDANNSSIAVCDYCGTKYVLESESSGNVHLGARTEFHIRDEQIRQMARSMQSGTPRSVPRQSGYPAARVFLKLALITLCIGGGLAINLYNSDSGGSGSLSVYHQESGGSETEDTIKLTGALAVFAEEVIQKSADTITEDDLARVTWLKMVDSGGSLGIGYSFADPDAEDAELTWMSLPEEAGTNMNSLPLFTGLKKLDVTFALSSGMLAGLQLESLTYYGNSLEDISGLLEDSTTIKELNITGSLKDLDGLDKFPGLTSLAFRGSYITDISNLALLKNLKHLTIERGDTIEDFSVLYVMTGLESLSIDSESVKDIGFVRDMPQLVSLSLIDAKILNLSGLAGKDQLQSLLLDNCNDLIDASGISGLTGLKHLYLELSYSCPDPDLNGLTELESLVITRMDTVKFLRNMSKLEELQLFYCTLDDLSVFDSLVSLKTFQCSSPDYDTNWNFVARIPGLEVITLNSVSTYKDISVLFNIPTLREIYLNGMECELKFASLQRNESLEIIAMDGVKLYKNVKVSGGGGITYVDYDKVILDENTSFFTNYPNLKQLSLADNKLTDVAFATELLYLEKIDITGNYVTDLKPLEGLDYLSNVYCTGNPIENYRVLSDEVVVIK